MNAASVFAALGDESRLSIISRLCKGGPRSIAQLAEGAYITRQAVTKHLLSLEDAGLVRSKRAGRERLWELDPKRLTEARRYLDRISEQWDARIDRLRAFVE